MNADRRAFVVAAMMLVASSVSAQDADHTSFVPGVVKSVILDPTTYAPAIVAWETTHLDWRSSQPFFRNGWREHNPRFTVSGRGDDTALDYAAGNRQILSDAVVNMQVSVLNNVSERVLERLLMPRYSTHRRLLRTIGWIERSAVASYWSYRLSANHFRKWQENVQRAQQLGFD
jgi:hypothetical protein